MLHIDAVLLNLFERACHAFQRLTGRTNVWLAIQLTNISIVVYFAWAGLYSWSGGSGYRIVFVLSGTALLLVLTQTVLAVPIEAAETAAYARVAKGVRNPRRVRDAVLRVSFLTLSLALGYPVAFVYVNLRLGIVLLSYLLIVLTTAVLYLLACDPLPPCRSKARAWLERAARPTLRRPQPNAPSRASGHDWRAGAQRGLRATPVVAVRGTSVRRPDPTAVYERHETGEARHAKRKVVGEAASSWRGLSRA